MHRTAGATLVVAALLAAPLVGCGADPLVEPAATPVDLQLPAPSYVLGTPAGLVVHTGADRVVLADASAGQLLPTGDALVVVAGRRARFRLVDPGTGDVLREVSREHPDMPGRSATRINLLDRYAEPAVVSAYDLGLRPLGQVELPVTDNPDATAYNELRRNYYNVAATVGDRTFVLWHDSSEWYEDGDYGVARIHHREGGAGAEVDDVLSNERLVALHLAADGSSLLALQQHSGKPCGGCQVTQDVVEIDPEAGTLADYGRPEEYEPWWRVQAVDRVGDRVAVRYAGSEGYDPGPFQPLIGTYVHEDGEWSLLPGSDEEITWWQDGGRVVARERPEGRHGDGYALEWFADGRTVGTPIRGELVGQRQGRRYYEGSIPGQLLPPE